MNKKIEKWAFIIIKVFKITLLSKKIISGKTKLPNKVIIPWRIPRFEVLLIWTISNDRLASHNYGDNRSLQNISNKSAITTISSPRMYNKIAFLINERLRKL
jgi:hypothetical protein